LRAAQGSQPRLASSETAALSFAAPLLVHFLWANKENEHLNLNDLYFILLLLFAFMPCF
jgi:hypothetical protein